jgi:hypothetical protein
VNVGPCRLAHYSFAHFVVEKRTNLSASRRALGPNDVSARYSFSILYDSSASLQTVGTAGGLEIMPMGAYAPNRPDDADCCQPTQ